MRFITLLMVSFISACSLNIVEMSPEPTSQAFDLKDNEGDGVINARDKCPDSEPGVRVDNNGCASETMGTLSYTLDVHFDANSSIVKNEYLDQIEQLAQFLSNHPEAQVLIEGHTSIKGSATYNKMMSNKRALSIKKVLVNNFAIEKERITTIGYGFEKLIDDGDTEEAHQKNRRIVAVVTADVSSVDMKWTIYSVDSEEE